MKKIDLGEFEEVILATIALLGDQAYGVAIAEALEAQTGRSASISAIHATLHRLENKGFVKSHKGGATAERGGRRKRFFTITPAGSRILHVIGEVRQHYGQQILYKALQWKMG